MQTKQIRSWMFVPGNRQRMIEKALALLSVDALMLDIEDGVAPAEKDAARQQIAVALDQVAKTSQKTPARYVRINSVGHERMFADLEAVVRPGLEGLVLPKVESADQVRFVDAILEREERKLKMEVGGIRLLVAIESPRGLTQTENIGRAASRVIGLIFGAEDFGKELGLPLRREGEAKDLLFARSAFACWASAANVQAVDGVWPDLNDMQGLTTFALQARRLGFTGMSLIHPSQVDAVNAAFTPQQEEIDYCLKVIKAFEDAQAKGEGAVAFGGQLLDRPIVERARRTLELAKEAAGR